MSETPSDARPFIAAFAALTPAQQELLILRLRDAVEALIVARARSITTQEGALHDAPCLQPQRHLN